MTEVNKEKLEAFREDLEQLLDKYGFRGIYRQIIETDCVDEAKEQLNTQS